MRSQFNPHYRRFLSQSTPPAPEPVEPNEMLMQYILTRIDMASMTSGRAAAQATHAGNQMTFIAKEPIMREVRTAIKLDFANPFAICVEMTDEERERLKLVSQWEAETGGGFGTAIIKGVTEAQMRKAVADAQAAGLFAEIVNDPDYFIKDGDSAFSVNVDTAAFIFGRHCDCQPFVRPFPLLSYETGHDR